MFNGSLRSVPVSKLRPGRDVRGRRESADDLVESLKNTPQLQTILVRPSGRDYEVIAGQRRLEAAKRLGISHLDVKIVEATDLQAEAYALAENLHRKAFRDEARAIARLVAIYKQLHPQPKRGPKAEKDIGHAGRKLVGAVERVALLTGKSVRATRRLAKVGGSGMSRAGDAVTVNEAERLLSTRRLGDKAEQHQHREPRLLRRAMESMDFAIKTLADLGAVPADDLKRVREQAASLVKATAKLKTAPVRAAADPVAAVEMVEKTCNRKLAPVTLKPGSKRPHFEARAPFMSTTSASLATCSPTCAFKGNGCYSQTGFNQWRQADLDDAARGLDPDDITKAEAAAIDAAFGGGPIPQDGARGGRDLRLHVAGDVRSTVGARALAGAAERWKQRGGGSVFTFTHSWRTVARRHWGNSVRVLASIEDPKDAARARKQGYAPALVVDRFPSEKAFTVVGSDVTFVPCPAETSGQVCTACRMCLDRDLFAENMGIAFEAHGQGAQRVRDQLVPLRLPPKRATTRAPDTEDLAERVRRS